METNVKAILFDLGNVLVRIDFEKVFEAWAQFSGKPAAFFRTRFSMDEPYRNHECGRRTGESYFAHLQSIFQVNLTLDQWHKGWNALFLEEFSELLPLLGRLKEKYPLYVLSNTNQTHRDYWAAKYAPLLASFDRVFTSDQLGSRKPEADAFHLVCREIGCSPDQVLFFDDTLENVLGARTVGMEAIHVQDSRSLFHCLHALVNQGPGGLNVGNDVEEPDTHSDEAEKDPPEKAQR